MTREAVQVGDVEQAQDEAPTDALEAPQAVQIGDRRPLDEDEPVDLLHAAPGRRRDAGGEEDAYERGAHDPTQYQTLR